MNYLTSLRHPKIHWECSVVVMDPVNNFSDVCKECVEIKVVISHIEWKNGVGSSSWMHWIFEDSAWYVDGVMINVLDSVVCTDATGEHPEHDDDHVFILYVQKTKAILGLI